jgi:hypothetical protein
MEKPRSINLKDIIRNSSLVAMTIAALGIIASVGVSTYNPEQAMVIAGFSGISGIGGLVGLIIYSGETFSSR